MQCLDDSLRKLKIIQIAGLQAIRVRIFMIISIPDYPNDNSLRFTY